MNNKALIKLSGVALIAGMLAIAGCQQGNTDGGTVDHTGGQYDPTGSGSMTVEFEGSDIIQTATMRGFRVHVYDSAGKIVENIPVICDTEAGLALIEPTTGKETTDFNGQISGKVGCDNPGSFLLACRLDGVSAKRQSITARCQGDRPVGFNGFPGAGGGGLGGGSADDTTINGARIKAVNTYDTGDQVTATTSIDITQSVCASSGTPTAEPFYDTSVKFDIVNDTPYIITFESLRYSVSNSSGGTITSGSLKVSGEGAAGIDSNGGVGTVSSLIFDASGGNKFYFGRSEAITSGFKNITFTLTGTSEIGETFRISTSTALSFDNFNRCNG